MIEGFEFLVEHDGRRDWLSLHGSGGLLGAGALHSVRALSPGSKKVQSVCSKLLSRAQGELGDGGSVRVHGHGLIRSIKATGILACRPVTFGDVKVEEKKLSSRPRRTARLSPPTSGLRVTLGSAVIHGTDKSPSRLERESREIAKGSGSGPSSPFAFSPPVLEEMFQLYRNGGSLVDIVLGDPMYARRFKARGWNINPTILQDHALAIRHWNELGIPTSKAAHRMRADRLVELQGQFKSEHSRFLEDAEARYGEVGQAVSGGHHEGWPEDAKNRSRFLAHSAQLAGEAASLHEALSKTRSPNFR